MQDRPSARAQTGNGKAVRGCCSPWFSSSILADARAGKKRARRLIYACACMYIVYVRRDLQKSVGGCGCGLTVLHYRLKNWKIMKNDDIPTFNL